MGVSPEAIRNVAVVGHGATGKTSLVEHVLAAAKVIDRPETVESGRTVSDSLDEEISRRISIRASLTHVEWRRQKINLLDTPGSTDFVGEVLASLRVAESAVVVVGADAGVQIETIKVWRRLDRWPSRALCLSTRWTRSMPTSTRRSTACSERFKVATSFR